MHLELLKLVIVIGAKHIVTCTDFSAPWSRISSGAVSYSCLSFYTPDEPVLLNSRIQKCKCIMTIAVMIQYGNNKHAREKIPMHKINKYENNLNV